MFHDRAEEFREMFLFGHRLEKLSCHVLLAIARYVHFGFQLNRSVACRENTKINHKIPNIASHTKLIACRDRKSFHVAYRRVPFISAVQRN